MKGNDGQMYVVKATKNGVRRWVRDSDQSKPNTRSQNEKPNNKAQAKGQKGSTIAGRSPPLKPLKPSKPLLIPATQHVHRIVYIVDNGSISFLVYLTSTGQPGVAHVFKRKDLDDDDDDTADYDPHDTSRHSEYFTHWRSIAYRNVHIGLDPAERREEVAKASQARQPGFFERLFGRGTLKKEWWHGGNSLLLETGPKSFVYIGSEIYAFRTPDDIVDYVSTMGGSAVPYPYAVGAKNVYLLTQMTYITHEHLNFLREKANRDDDVADPYDLFYRRDLETGEPAKPRSSSQRQKAYLATHKLKSFKLLHARLL